MRAPEGPPDPLANAAELATPGLAQELGALARGARRLAELERLLGARWEAVPSLPPLPAFAVRAVAPELPAPRPGPEVAAAATWAAAVPALTRAMPPGSTPGREAAASDGLAQRRAHNEARLHGLANRLAGCIRCALHEGRTQLVFGQGDAAAELVFVGEGPGEHEDRQGLAFVGRSGDLLTKMIQAMGLERDEVFICNVVKCRPPGNRAPAPDEMGTCSPFLREQLDAIQPRAICALGKTAAVGLGLIPPGAPLGAHRGAFKEWNGIPTMLTYHPAYLLRSPGEKVKAWRDLKALFPYLERRRSAPPR